MAELQAGERATALRARLRDDHLTLERDRVRHQATAGVQGLPARVDQARRGHAAADEHGLGRFEGREGVGRLASYELEVRHPELPGVALDALSPVVALLDRDGAGG